MGGAPFVARKISVPRLAPHRPVCKSGADVAPVLQSGGSGMALAPAVQAF
ncbi:hypothetical protein RGUI_1640 [Rhodovulum sp. P5]|nr:hypothetical protein RGUI_1640 [Rhodovulum sp. P5]